MPRVIHQSSFPRRVAANVDLNLKIKIGNVQHGEWWVKIDDNVHAHDTKTDAVISLGKAKALYGRMIQIEVRCDDTNPHTDKLACTIELTPVTPVVKWKTDNAGNESPHGMMTSLADIFILPVKP